MSRNLKVLGLGLVAAFAMSAVMASAASATLFKFKSEAASTVLTGKQHATNQDVFTTDSGTVTCNEATYTGSQTGTESSEVSVTPTYSNCTAFGFISVPIDVHGCSYKFTTVTKEGTSFEGSVHIECPTGSVIEVTAPNCTVTVPPQTPTGGTNSHITYTNVGSGTTREITTDVALEGIHYEEHGSSCKGPVTTTKTNGTYTGAALITGETSKKVHLGIWVE